MSPEFGPSGNAWGVDLCDPVMVSHEGRLVVFARAKAHALTSLYYTVTEAGANESPGADAGWNGWYRHDFPEAAVLTSPADPEGDPILPELRLAGMDLITLPDSAVSVAAADAAFRVLSDGSFLAVFRQSTAGRIYLNRLALIATSLAVGGKTERRFHLEGAFELRFRRSGLRDVPADDTDVQSYTDPVGVPFREPTVELPGIAGVDRGRFAVAASATADPTRSVLFVAVVTGTGVALHRLVRTDVGVADLSEPPRHYTPIAPSLRAGGAPLVPIDALSPGLVVFAEHDAATTAAGDTADLMRGLHLMLTLPVSGGGLSAAMAIYDFALDVTGDIADLPAADQSLVLVDGAITNGTFVPDTTAPVYPQPADLAATTRMINGLTVMSMALGQVQPRKSPWLTTGDDGLLHLYHGGPLPGQAVYRWGNLDPNLPQAMVAQFDARTNRLTLSLPWHIAAPAEQPDGTAQFVALQGGSIMEGATVTVADPATGLDPAALCNVRIAYPAATGLPAKDWSAVPRELGAFMAVLNGHALGDSAAPEVLSGSLPFFDTTGALAVVPLPLALPAGSMAGPKPALLFASTRADISLTAIDWANTGTRSSSTFHFKASGQPAITVTWAGFPANPAGLADIFAGVAAPATWNYPAPVTDTPLFALETDATGIPAPVVLYPQTGATDRGEMTITVTAASATTVDVSFQLAGNPKPAPVTVQGISAEVAKFAAALRQMPASRR